MYKYSFNKWTILTYLIKLINFSRLHLIIVAKLLKNAVYCYILCVNNIYIVMYL